MAPLEKEIGKMLIGYARTSTTDQVAGFEAQERDLRGQGCETIFAEQTGATGARPKLEEMLRFIREGDTLVVTKLDRLARSMVDLQNILKTLSNRKANLKILGLGLDSSTATGQLMLNVLGSVAQFERSIMLERQREGIAKAKQEGKFQGRPPSIPQDKVLELTRQGYKRGKVAQELGIGVASVYRILASHKNSHLKPQKRSVEAL
jgi:DNA invertase Pin-like site-specific DNA recombinase